MTQQDSTATTTSKPGRTLSVIGAVLGVLALLFLPVVLGPVGAILGFVGNAKGDKPFGMWVGIGCIVATIAGFALSAVLLGAING